MPLSVRSVEASLAQGCCDSWASVSHSKAIWMVEQLRLRCRWAVVHDYWHRRNLDPQLICLALVLSRRPGSTRYSFNTTAAHTWQVRSATGTLVERGRC